MGNSTPHPEKPSKLSLEKLLYRGAQDLSHAEFRVLAVLMTYTDGEGHNAHPAAAKLARETGCGKATVTRALQRLEALGYVVKTEQGGNAVGRGMANVYDVVIPKSVEVTPLEAGRVSTEQRKGVVRATQGCSHDTPSGPLPDPSSHPASNPPSSTSPGSPDRFACSKDEAWNTEPTPWDEEPEYDWSAA